MAMGHNVPPLISIVWGIIVIIANIHGPALAQPTLHHYTAEIFYHNNGQ